MRRCGMAERSPVATRKRRRAPYTPPPPPVVPDPHEEITAVDLLGAVKVASGRIKPRVLCCGGTGFDAEILGEPLCVPCWCPAGLRLKCATAADAWPLHRADAERIGRRIGLVGAA